MRLGISALCFTDKTGDEVGEVVQQNICCSGWRTGE